MLRMCSGSVFYSFGAAMLKALSPKERNIFTLGYSQITPPEELREYKTGFLIRGEGVNKAS